MQNQIRIQLVSTGQFLDVQEDTGFPLTFAIADIRDISKRTGSFSKTITLQGNKNNNTILNNYYDVNIQAGTFDINRRTLINVIQNGATIMQNATLQLQAINKTQHNSNYEEIVTYSCLIKDTSGDFYSQINNKYLSDLPSFGKMNHLLNANNVKASLTNTYVQGYKYVFPYKEFIDNTKPTYDVTEIYPGIYAKTIMDYIFSSAGFSYQWDEQFDKNIQFDKLLIPYNGGTLATSALEDENYLVSISGGTQQNNFTTFTTATDATYPNRKIIGDNGLGQSLSMPNEIIDLAGLYNTGSGTYVTPNIGTAQNYIQLEYEVSYNILAVNTLGSTVYLKGFEINEANKTGVPVNLPLMLQPTGSMRRFSGGFRDCYAKLYNGAGIPIFSGAVAPGTNIVFVNSVTVKSNEALVPSNIAELFRYNLETDLNQVTNNKLPLKFNFYTSPTETNPKNYIASTTAVRYALQITNIKLKARVRLDGKYGYNILVNMNRMLPEKVKQSDFLKSICQMYNVYMVQDPDNATKIIFKTRDKFYDEGVNKDWTFKLCKDKDQELQFLPELQNKKILLTYKQDDNDPLLKKYQTITKEIYGQFEYTFDNEYVKDIDKKELIFSPTVILQNFYDHIVPSWALKEPKMNPRIVIDGGLQPILPSGFTYTITNKSGDTTNVATTPTIPLLSNFDNPGQPNFDINYGICDYYYPKNQEVTNNTLFNLHWRRTLNQINNGRLYIAHFNLNEQDIATLKMNDKIRIDNGWWNINKIIDYDANSISPTKVELISIDDNLNIRFTPRVPRRLQFDDPIWDFPIWQYQNPRQLNTIGSPFFNQVIGQDNIIGFPSTNNQIWGSYNRISTDYSWIVGDNNSVSGKKAYVVGNNNDIQAGVDNVQVIGDNLTATTSNSVLVENIIISGNVNGTPINTIATVKFPDTGVIFYSGATSASPTTINITPVVGYIADCETNSTAVTQTKIVYSGGTNVFVPTLSSGTATYVMLGKGSPNVDATDGSYGGQIIFQNTFPTSAQRKSSIWLSKISHPVGFISFVINEVDFLNSPAQQFRDFTQAFIYVNNGVVAYPNTGLTFNVTGGNLYGNGINYVQDKTIPNNINVGPFSPTNFVYRTQTGGTTGFISTLDPANYDAGGVITPVGGGINNSTIQYVFFVPGAGFLLQRGQFIYSTFADAVSSVGRENFVQLPAIVNNSILIGVIVMKRSATDVNNTADVLFLRADKIGQIIGSAGGTSTGTLQSAYNNSLQPQIVLNPALGALQIQSTTAVVSNPAFQILNTAGTINFVVSEQGGVTGRTFNNHFLNINTTNSNYLGSGAGSGSSSVGANFIGLNAGSGATTSSQSNFIGQNAGQGATIAPNSNFFGQNAGQNSTNATNSQFIGQNAGQTAPNASNSVFIGANAGQQATASFRSIFIGSGAGLLQPNASYNNLIGWQAGYNITSAVPLGSNNTIIGTNISLPSGSTNSFNLGGVIFGDNMYSLTATNPSISAQTNGRVGINTLPLTGANFAVAGSISATTYLNLQDRKILNNLSTGLISGGVLTTASTTTFNISAGNGMIVNNTTNPNSPTFIDVSWSGFTNVPVLNIATTQFSHVYITSAGAVLQSNSVLTPADIRDKIYLGAIISLGSNITSIYSSIVHLINPVSQLNDLTASIGLFSLNGNIIQKVIGTLQLAKTQGNTFNLGGNYQFDRTTPNQINCPATTGDTMLQVTQTGFSGQSNVISTTQYDLNGVITALPNNKFTNCRIWLKPDTNKLIFQYGQFIYDNFSDAKNGTTSENYITPAGLNKIAYLVAIIITKQGITNLDNNLTDSEIILQQKFAGTGGGGGSTPNFQNVYDVSPFISIITDATRGAFAVRNGSGVLDASANVYEGYNSAGTSTFNVRANGAITGTSYNGHLLNINSVGGNFIGTNAGQLATGATNSTFIGTNAGQSATTASNSQFIGQLAGRLAINALSSVFIGNQAGNNATNANNSTFVGTSAGQSATNANNSTFIGQQAGQIATNSSTAVFVGNQCGNGANNATGSTFMGNSAGQGATSATTAVFIGDNAGRTATQAINSVFIGSSAGFQASQSANAIFIGNQAGRNVNNASQAIMIGLNAGTGSTTANYAIMIGANAGQNAPNATNSIFLGEQAGISATTASESFIVGFQAGFKASGANNSFIYGNNAGNQALNANDSIFLGFNAGALGTNASNSTFIGRSAGSQATNASGSTFIGFQAGGSSTNGQNSVFIGTNAGFNAQNANNCNLIGYNVGRGAVHQIGSGNTIIGTNVSVTAGTTNSLNIGGILFGTGLYGITGGNPSVTSNVLVATGGTGAIGIGVVNPTETLDIQGAVKLRTSYSGLTNGATTPVPAGGAGTMVYDTVNNHFFGWIGTSWRQLDN